MDSVVNSCYNKKTSVHGIIRQQQDNQRLPYSPFHFSDRPKSDSLCVTLNLMNDASKGKYEIRKIRRWSIEEKNGDNKDKWKLMSLFIHMFYYGLVCMLKRGREDSQPDKSPC